VSDVEILLGDARHTELPSNAFDVVHARTLLITVPDPVAVSDGIADDVGVDDVGFVVGFGFDGVELVVVSAAGEGGVGGFAVEVFVAEDVGTVAGEALGFVDGHGVPVVEAAGVGVGGGDRGASRPGVEQDLEVAGAAIDAGDESAFAV
jgi:hypothetical protein